MLKLCWKLHFKISPTKKKKMKVQREVEVVAEVGVIGDEDHAHEVATEGVDGAVPVTADVEVALEIGAGVGHVTDAEAAHEIDAEDDREVEVQEGAGDLVLQLHQNRVHQALQIATQERFFACNWDNLGLSGQRLLGVPIMVQPTQSEKNKVAEAQLSLQQAALGPTKLYVGSLHENITEDMLKGIFSPFGRITSVEIVKDAATGRSQGYAFVTFTEAENAKRAMDQLNGFEIAGKAIKLNTVAPTADFSLFSTLANAPSFLDNENVERAGIDLGTTGRLQLMAKLAEGTGLEVPRAAQQALQMGQSMGLGLPNNQLPGTTNGSSGSPPITTTCFQLSNMFDPAKESGVGWDKEIRDDVIEECQRHGKVHHVYVDKQSQGNVYVKCDTIETAARSVSALHGRYFAGNMITAAYVPIVNYHSLFPDAAYATPINSSRN